MERSPQKIRGRKLFLSFLFILLLIPLGAFVWFHGSQSRGNRMTIVLASDPMTVISWDKKNGIFTLLSLPSDTTIEAVHGYGQYSLESLWKLGTIEGKAGTVLAESVEELLGVPVQGYLGGRNHVLLTKKDAREIFSLGHILTLVRGGYATDISPASFWSFSWAISQTRPENIRTIDLSTSVVDQTLPDGSLIHMADINRMDQKIGTAFEDETIRKEARSIAVLNTTPVLSLGTRVGRLLSHVGMLVITIGNDRPTRAACTIHGTKKALESQTARFIQDLYRCTKKDPVEGDRADVTIRIGTTYQARFLPFGSRP